MKLALLLSFAFFIVFLSLPSGVTYWDEAVYSGMGEYFASAGEHGIYEEIRPPALPFFLGILSFFGNTLFLGRIFICLISAASIFLFYLILTTYVNKAFAFLGSFLLGITPVYLFFSGKILSGMLSLFFVLLAFYFYRKEKYLLMSFFCGLAFLTRFPAGLFFPIFFLFSFKKNSQKILSLLIFSGTCLISFLLNLFLGYNPITSFLSAAAHQSNSAFAGPWWFYLSLFLFSPVLLASALGGYYALVAKKYDLVVLAFVPLLYFSSIVIKQERFFLLVFPFFLLLAIYGMQRFVQRESNILALMLVLLLAFGSVGVSLYLFEAPSAFKEPPSYIDFFSDENALVLTTTPFAAPGSSSLFIPLYYSPEDALIKLKNIDSDYIIYLDGAWNCVEYNCEQSILAIESLLAKKNLLFEDEGVFVYSNQ